MQLNRYLEINIFFDRINFKLLYLRSPMHYDEVGSYGKMNFEETHFQQVIY
jgi:hypothetical protein